MFSGAAAVAGSVDRWSLVRRATKRFRCERVTRGSRCHRRGRTGSRYLKGRSVRSRVERQDDTTSLIAELLKDAGLPTLLGGNIGTPLISLVESSRDDGWTVVEMSSFQLETIKEFHPTVALVLNVTPNHMDRYESFTDYAAAKHRIFMNQAAGDVAILNADDLVVSSWASGLRAHITCFSVSQELDEGLFLRGNEIVSRAADSERVLLMSDEMKLRGKHNVENVLAALAAGLACGAAPESMRETISNFAPVEHRLEFVSEIKRVKFYNDSKATSVDATLKRSRRLKMMRKSNSDSGWTRQESAVCATRGAGREEGAETCVDRGRRRNDLE